MSERRDVADRLRSLVSELRRRKVWQVGGMYLVVAAGVIGLASDVVPAVELPEATVRLVTVLALLGFPVALVLGWTYDLTWGGVERTETSSGEQSDTSSAVSAEPLPAGTAARSIVVLPFDNLSPDADDAYLSDGITEEITTDLSALGSLRVISRSSASVFKDRGDDVRGIGRKLGVRYVLEGSVRKAGDSLRVTAQLIDARTDDHLWAERYSGTMEDVFAMQEEVARSIVGALQIQLTPEEDRQLGERPIEDLRAYEYYLRAREESWRFAGEALDRAVQHLERALQIVGENPVLLSGLAYVHSQYVNAGIRGDEAADLAEQYARRALELDPASPQAHLVLGFLYQAVWRDPERSARHLEQSLRVRPDDSHALLWLAVAYSLIGDYPSMKAAAEGALEVDPLTPMLQVMRGFVPMMEGRFEDAVADFAEWYRRVPDNPAAIMFYGLVLVWSGRREEARLHLSDELPSDPNSSFGRFALLLRYALDGREESVSSLLSGSFRENMVRDTQFAIFTASAHALAGMKSGALEWTETAVEGGFTNYPWLAEYDPCLSEYREDPRFESILSTVQARWTEVRGSTGGSYMS